MNPKHFRWSDSDESKRPSGQELESDAEAKARNEELERDLGRIARVTRALEDLRKGLLTTDELLKKLRDPDLADFLGEQELPLDIDLPEGARGAPPPPERGARKDRTKRRRRRP